MGENQEIKVAKELDLTGTVCPMTSYQARLQVSRVNDGDVVKITLKKGDQVKEVSQTIKSEGHRVLEVERDDENGILHLLVRKGG